MKQKLKLFIKENEVIIKNINHLNKDQEIIESNLLDVLEDYYKNPDYDIIEIIKDPGLSSVQKGIIKLLDKNVPVKDKNDDFFQAYILIPYRARGKHSFRKEQLKRFITHMKLYMKKINPRLNYKIVIIEQNNNHYFNRGLLLNAGFLECEKIHDHHIKYYIHYNCDLFPDINYPRKIDYSFTPENIVRDHFGYTGGLGGVCVINRKTFKKINGFPNDYYIWGNEDVTIKHRCTNLKIKIERPTYNQGIKEENHIRDDSFNFINQEKGLKDKYLSNGLTTIKYTSEKNVDSEFNQNMDDSDIIHYLIDFEYNRGNI